MSNVNYDALLITRTNNFTEQAHCLNKAILRDYINLYISTTEEIYTKY